jgi:hypothetical protein
MGMLIEHTKYDDADAVVKVVESDNAFHCCECAKFSIEDGHVDSNDMGVIARLYITRSTSFAYLRYQVKNDPISFFMPI